MNYYKITNKEEIHNGLKYKTGLNTDILPFNPEGDCAKGGIYFSRENILAFLNYGCWIRQVTLPKDAKVYENPGSSKKWKADKIKLGKRRLITAEVIEELINEGADVHADNDFALIWASKYGHTEIVKVLLKHGADIHADNDYALIWASDGHTEIVKVLLKHGADVHADNDYALRWASEYGHTEIVKVLKKYMNK